jgi:hypothetical protein
MPVRKLRSLQEAEEAVWWDPKDPNLWAAICAVWDLSRRLAPPAFPPGVHKHRSVEDANQLVEAWEAANMRRRDAGRPD